LKKGGVYSNTKNGEYPIVTNADAGDMTGKELTGEKACDPMAREEAP